MSELAPDLQRGGPGGPGGPATDFPGGPAGPGGPGITTTGGFCVVGEGVDMGVGKGVVDAVDGINVGAGVGAVDGSKAGAGVGAVDGINVGAGVGASDGIGVVDGPGGPGGPGKGTTIPGGPGGPGGPRGPGTTTGGEGVEAVDGTGVGAGVGASVGIDVGVAAPLSKVTLSIAMSPPQLFPRIPIISIFTVELANSLRSTLASCHSFLFMNALDHICLSLAKTFKEPMSGPYM